MTLGIGGISNRGGTKRTGGIYIASGGGSSGVLDTAQCTLQINNSSVASGSLRTITLQVKDGAGNNMTATGLTIVPTKTGGTATGTLSGVTDNGSGNVTWTYTGILAGTPQTLSCTINGTPIVATVSITVTPGPIDRTVSVVIVSVGSAAEGSANQLVGLQAIDAAGNNLTTGGATVVFGHSGGTSVITIGSTTDAGTGVYFASIAPVTAGTATTMSATINGQAVTTTMPTFTVNAASGVPTTAGLTEVLIQSAVATPVVGSYYHEKYDRYTTIASVGDGAGGQAAYGIRTCFEGGVTPSNQAFVAGESGGQALSMHFVTDPIDDGTPANHHVWTGPWTNGNALIQSYALGRYFNFEMRFRARNATGYPLCKWIELVYNNDSAAPIGRIQCGIWYTHRNPSWHINPNGPSDYIAHQPIGPYPDTVFTGSGANSWHTFTLRYRPNTTNGSGGYGSVNSSRDGVFQVYLDDIKIIDLSAAGVGVTPTGGQHPYASNHGELGSDCGDGLDWLPAGVSHNVGFFRFPEYTNVATGDFDLDYDYYKYWIST